MKRLQVALAVVNLAVTAGTVWEDSGEGIQGAWARADAPEKPCLVITNSIVWTLSKGIWRPSDGSVDAESDQVAYQLIGEEALGTQVIKALNEYECKAFADQGVMVEPGAIGWFTEIRRESGRTEIVNPRRVVRVRPPAWKKLRQLKKYQGVWKLTSGEAGRWRPAMIKIRPDGRAVFYFGEDFARRNQGSATKVFRFRACEGGIRLESSRSRGEGGDPLNEYVDGLWLNPQGELVRYPGHSDGIDTYVRTDAPFADPLDARETMAKQGAISGIWGVSVEFTVFMLAFCEDGRGIMSGFMAQVPFRWKKGKQRIHCVLDKDLASLAGENLTEFDCEYDAVQDQMVLNLPAGAKAVGSREMPTKLPRLPGEIAKEQMDAIFKRVEGLKQDPQFKMELERMKRR